MWSCCFPVPPAVSTPGSRFTPRILVAFACVYVFWGSTYFAMRTGVAVLPPLILIACRFLLAGPLMLAVCALRGLSLRLSRRDLGYLVAIGILMLGIGNAGVVFAEQHIASGFASLLFAVIPIYVALLEALLPAQKGHPAERLNSRGWLGILIGFAGLLTLLWPSLHQDASGGSRQVLGCAIALFSALAWSAASVLSRRARVSTPTFVAAAYEMLIAGVFSLAVLLATTGASLRHLDLALSPPQARQAVLSVAWLVVFGSLVGYTAYIYLLDHVPVAKVATYAYINPIVAVLLGAAFLHERMHVVEYAGMLFILAAVYLVTSSKLGSAPTPISTDVAETRSAA